MLERDIDQSFPPLVTAIGNGQHTKSGHLYLTLLTAYALACIACWQGSHHTVPSATRISVAPPACQNIRVFVRIRSALLKPTAEEREIVVLKHLSITTATKDKSALLLAVRAQIWTTNHANMLFRSVDRPFAVTGVEHFRLSSEAPCISMRLMLPPLDSHLRERNSTLARHLRISPDDSYFGIWHHYRLR